jgi:diketogulonate reductase-like aldo/keto reductase
VRAFCRAHDIRYQGFSLLNANREVLRHAGVGRVARRLGASSAQVVFRYALEVGMLPLTGTSNVAHGREALAVYDLPPPTAEELELLEHVGERA